MLNINSIRIKVLYIIYNIPLIGYIEYINIYIRINSYYF